MGEHGTESKIFSVTDMAYKYFFRTINGQAERLLQSADVSFSIEDNAQ